jgi:hypothetical protein
MIPYASVAIKSIGAVTAAALLSIGAVSAAPSPSPSPTAAGNPQLQQSDKARHHDRRAIRRAIIESEAGVLGMRPAALVMALKEGKTVAELARAKGLTKAQFTARLLVQLTLRLDRLVDNKVITPAQAKKVLAHIASGHVPFWDGIHLRK